MLLLDFDDSELEALLELGEEGVVIKQRLLKL